MLIAGFIDEVLLFFFVVCNKSRACDVCDMFSMTRVFRGDTPKTAVLSYLHWMNSRLRAEMWLHKRVVVGHKVRKSVVVGHESRKRIVIGHKLEGFSKKFVQILLLACMSAEIGTFFFFFSFLGWGDSFSLVSFLWTNLEEGQRILFLPGEVQRKPNLVFYQISRTLNPRNGEIRVLLLKIKLWARCYSCLVFFYHRNKGKRALGLRGYNCCKGDSIHKERVSKTLSKSKYELIPTDPYAWTLGP